MKPFLASNLWKDIVDHKSFSKLIMKECFNLGNHSKCFTLSSWTIIIKNNYHTPIIVYFFEAK